jgi:hypothetical protein
MKESNTADFIALVAIFLLVLSGSLNIHLFLDNAQLRAELQGFKDGTQYGK